MTVVKPLAGPVDLPSANEVARDMVLEGRLDDARAALDQAPNRLARGCPACSARPGEECDDLDISWEDPASSTTAC